MKDKSTNPDHFDDTDLLDFLQRRIDEKKYTGKVIMRWSTTGRGIRLHETSKPDAVPDVRKAIRDFIKRGMR